MHRWCSASPEVRSAAQVIVGLVDPVLPRRAEHVDVERVLERFGPVRDVRRDREDLARTDRDLLLAAAAQPQTEGTLEDVGDLLAFMRVCLDDRAALVED